MVWPSEVAMRLAMDAPSRPEPGELGGWRGVHDEAVRHVDWDELR